MAETVEQVIEEAERKMKLSVEAVEREMAGVRTGRASPALLESVRVEYYGSQLPINQVATVSVPEPRLIVVAPWDANALPAIERAILTSDLGLTPQNDGKVIRLQVPPLTEERRKELVRLVGRMAEDGRVAIRNLRRDANEKLEKMEKAGTISEDERDQGKKRVQELTDKYVEQVDAVLERKTEEIMEQ
ncbi:MAG: ribosome recycling factor [Armatimonadetes bacterium]|nr:ribosome recycling factor [Armatimonadota bacterium]